MLVMQATLKVDLPDLIKPSDVCSSGQQANCNIRMGGGRALLHSQAPLSFLKNKTKQRN